MRFSTTRKERRLGGVILETCLYIVSIIGVFGVIAPTLIDKNSDSSFLFGVGVIITGIVGVGVWGYRIIRHVIKLIEKFEESK